MGIGADHVQDNSMQQLAGRHFCLPLAGVLGQLDDAWQEGVQIDLRLHVVEGDRELDPRHGVPRHLGLGSRSRQVDSSDEVNVVAAQPPKQSYDAILQRRGRFLGMGTEMRSTGRSQQK